MAKRKGTGRRAKKKALKHSQKPDNVPLQQPAFRVGSNDGLDCTGEPEKAVDEKMALTE